jgi:capsular exopolysaccharide synthesis family protein
MELRDYIRVVAERWLVLVSVTVLGVVVGLGLGYIPGKSYTATAKLFASVNTTNTPSNASAVYSTSQFLLQRMTSYTQLSDSGDVLQPVITKLGLKDDVQQLSSKVSIVNPTQTFILEVEVTSPSAVKAADIANAVADSLSSEIPKLERAGKSTSPVLVTVTKRAVAPSSPASPRPKLDLLLGLVVGLLLGLGLAILRSQFDRTVRSVSQVADMTGASPLALVKSSKRLGRSPLSQRDPKTREELEAFRSLRASLELAGDGASPRRLVVTSTLPSEGRTTVACNLAIVAARSGSRVCLVEADLRRPAVGKYLGLAPGPGLGAVLAGEATVDAAVVESKYGSLSVLTAGRLPDDPAAALGSRKMSETLAALADRFDLVIIDTPAILSVSDALVLAHTADATLVVVRYGETPRSSLADALDALQRAGSTVSDTVLVGLPRRLTYHEARSNGRAEAVVQTPEGRDDGGAHSEPKIKSRLRSRSKPTVESEVHAEGEAAAQARDGQVKSAAEEPSSTSP